MKRRATAWRFFVQSCSMANIQHSTMNIQRSSRAPRGFPWMLNVECSLLNVPRIVLRAVSVLLLAAVLTGCASVREPAIVFTGDIMVDGPNAIEHGPKKDKVLWQYRTAAAAMRRGQFDLAKRYLDDALLTLGGIYGPDKEAKRARGYFHEEARKTFIGEPYERVMAYYYRGILYWMDGEPDNARACFRSAALEDTGTQDEQYAADYAILDYLDGLATTKLGGDGSDAFQRADKESRLSKLPSYNSKANVIFFLESGRGPTKYAGGEYGEQLRFRDEPSPARNATISVAGQNLTAGPVDDLVFQATTRGGRMMDFVLGNKAVFKSATSSIGDVGIIGGAVLMGSQHGRHNAGDEVGLGLLAAGLLSKALSAATTPDADVRSWDNLPRYLTFATLSLPPGQQTAKIEFQDAAGRPLPGLTKTVTFTVPADGKDKIVFVSDQSVTPINL
jgi:tetratricopeptide (TPR) repeat protein